MSFTAPVHVLQLDLPPRQQWEGNYGYCGEVALLSGGLYYGQYVSQYDARAIASPGVDQTAEGSQLLLGVNDEYAAAQMQLGTKAWDSAVGKSTREFLSWTKQMIARGYPVMIGIFLNERRFYGAAEPESGDLEYDHIVPVVGVRSNRPPSDTDYCAEDVLVFSDNGLWAPDGAAPPYLFAYPFDSLPASRRAANARPAVYSLNSACNYGLAITGVADRDGDTLPVRVQTDLHAEPAIGDDTGARPKAVPVQLTVTIHALQPGVDYRLYRYSSFAAVPDSHFNAAAANAARTWNVRISAGTTYVLQETIQSNEITAYRAVRAEAP